MHVIVSADEFAKGIGGVTASELLADGVQAADPTGRVDVWAFPPEGQLLESVQRSLGGVFHDIPVVDVFWQPSKFRYLLVGEGPDQTAYVETDRLFPPLAPVAGGAKSLFTATSFGLGEALLHIMIAGISRIVLLVGRRMICDGGIGMLQALGAVVGNARGETIPNDTNPLLEMRYIDTVKAALLLRRVNLTVMTDYLFTYSGADSFSPIEALRYRFSQDQKESIDQHLQEAQVLLQTSQGTTIADVPGSGAGGGVVGALLAVGAQPAVSLAPWLGDLVGFNKVLQHTDLLVTAAPVLTPVMGKIGRVMPLTRLARAAHVPVVIALQGDHTPDPELSQLFADTYLTRVMGIMGSESIGIWRRGLRVAGSELVTRFMATQETS
ncbi:MAG: glycerate kinase [Schleiferilactobacillus harbinensis]|jgi:glycerate kinase|nr:glycerate kinase [Schleiferilactobacillus harbinensis]